MNNTSLTIADGFTNLGDIELTNDFGGARSMLLVVSNGTLVNQGTISVLAGAGGGARTIDAEIDNRGTIELVDSDLSITNAGRTFTSDAGTVDIASGQTLTISGGTTGLGSALVAGAGTLNLSEIRRAAGRERV